MAIQNVYTFRCPNPNCTDYFVLPRQTHLGKFDDQSSPSKDIWPILYLCLCCEQLSEVPAQAICQERVETQGQYRLVRYDFSSDQSGSLQHFGIYTKEKRGGIADQAIRQQDARGAIEYVLKPSGLWDKSYGERIEVSIDPGLKYDPPSKGAEVYIDTFD
jgi:hypothetical protein